MSLLLMDDVGRTTAVPDANALPLLPPADVNRTSDVPNVDTFADANHSTALSTPTPPPMLPLTRVVDLT